MTERSTIELTVIAPCYNEEGNIAELVRRMMAVYDEHSIAGELVINGDLAAAGSNGHVNRFLAAC